MKVSNKCHILIMLFLIAPFTFASQDNMDSQVHKKAKRAVDYGLHFLRETQDKNGSWSKSVGVTALVLRAFLESPRKYNEGDGPFITKPIDFILAHVNEDGSISETNQKRNYNTAIAMIALQATGNAKYSSVIENAQKFLMNLQLDEDLEYPRSHKYYGGIGYGGDERPDLSNTYIALEGLKETSLNPMDPVWEKALVFVNRCQNLKESNDQDWAENDGGFTYMPGYSPHGKSGSYGGMTHAGLVSLLFAGMDKNDKRVKAAYEWIRGNYTLDDNPGAKKKQGLFYYYNAFAKSMYAFGEKEITDTNGTKHNWREDLANKLLSLQNKDGSWVNKDSGRWWEGDKNLVTAWSAIALNIALRN